MKTQLFFYAFLFVNLNIFAQPTCDNANSHIPSQESTDLQVKNPRNLNASLAISDTISRDSGDIIWLGGHDGVVVHWEISIDYGQSWEVVKQNTDFFMYDSPQSTFYCRVYLKADNKYYYSNTITKTVIESLTCYTEFEK